MNVDATPAPASHRGDARRELARLFDTEFDAVYRFCLARLGSSTAAEDVAADTFHAAARQFRAGRGDQVNRPWLFVVARNRMVDHWRARERRRVRDERLVAISATGGHTEDDPIENAPSERVLRALASLPERQRTVLALRFLEERSVAEIADELGVGYRAAESLLARARRGFEEAWRAS